MNESTTTIEATPGSGLMYKNNTTKPYPAIGQVWEHNGIPFRIRNIITYRNKPFIYFDGLNSNPTYTWDQMLSGDWQYVSDGKCQHGVICCECSDDEHREYP